MNRKLPGVSVGDQTGNPFQRDLDYRGFVASPVQGTPQGIAVYQNGVRINESYGDVVNWDFIPEKAIDRLSLVPNNPIFGLNAIGGALTIEMKNGFTYQGKEAEAIGGSYGRVQGSVQAGGQKDNVSAYATSTPPTTGAGATSRIRRTCTACTSTSARATTNRIPRQFHRRRQPARRTSRRRRSRCSLSAGRASIRGRRSTHLQLAFLTATLNYNFSDTWSFQGNAYFRGFWQSHIDGNGTDAQPCDPAGRKLCIDGASGSDPIFVRLAARRCRTPSAPLFSARSTATRLPPEASAAPPR